MNEIDKNLTPEYENEKDDNNRVVFIPAEEIRLIESIYNKMEQAKQEFSKVAEIIRQI